MEWESHAPCTHSTIQGIKSSTNKENIFNIKLQSHRDIKVAKPLLVAVTGHDITPGLALLNNIFRWKHYEALCNDCQHKSLSSLERTPLCFNAPQHRERCCERKTFDLSWTLLKQLILFKWREWTATGPSRPYYHKVKSFLFPTWIKNQNQWISQNEMIL